MATKALLRGTNDFSGSLVTAENPVPLTSNLAMPAAPFYVAMLFVFATTSPNVASINVAGSGGGAGSIFPIPGDTTNQIMCQQTGLADLPAPLVADFNTASAMPWFALRSD